MASSTVRTAAVSLLKGNALAAALRDGTLSKKQLRSAVAEKLDMSPDEIKSDAALREALDEVFTEFVAKFQYEQQVTKENDALSKHNQGGREEQCPRALLRGKLSIDGSGRATWKGTWAFSKVEWDKGERSSFRLLSKDKWEAACLEDGRWVAFVGHFLMRVGGSSQRREKEKFAKLRFMRNEEGKFSVAGKGKNGFGTWRLELGIYEPQSGRLSARRAYEDSSSTSRTIAADAPLASDDEEDEDFDADDEEEDNEQQVFSFGPQVAMRGELRFEAEQWTWRGEWGATGDALEAGDVGRFQYTGPGEQTLPLKLNLSGSFELRGPSGTRDVAEPRLCLRFAGSRVKGRGHNEFGDFTIAGQLDGDLTLRCSKKYASNEDDDDIENDDFVDDRDALAEELADLAAEAAEAGAAGDESRRKRPSASGEQRIAHKRFLRPTIGRGEVYEPHRRRNDSRRQGDGDVGQEVIATVQQLGQSMNAIEQALQARHFNEARNLLLKLNRVTVTVDLLAETGIGKFVGKLRKRIPASWSLYFRYPSFSARHSNPQIREIARTLVDEWKKVVLTVHEV